ncbi:hypothetical protein ACN20G_37100 (plasmid) [Streptomyces sp. BI20]|uniref:hypothetical protein n=1 Tax=Streptomyces sp. BI20 TaxID=3403460 RepID=UPI003C73BE09
MEPFVPQYQGAPWPAGPTPEDGVGVLHVYALPRPGVDDDLLDLVRACGPAMTGYPLDPQLPAGEPGAGLLHATVEMLADAPAAAYDQAARDDLVAALRKELAGVPPFVTEAGPPIAGLAGVVVDLWPDAEFLALAERVRGAVRRTRGDAALRHSGGRPHVSAAYAYGAASSDRLNTVLRGITPRRVPFTIDRVHLLDVSWRFDAGLPGWRMSWTPVAEIPLGGVPRRAA